MAKHTTNGRIVRLSFVPFLLLALPLMEIAGFVIVGKQVGALATVALVLASTMLGCMLLRRQGFSTMATARAEIDAGRDPSRPLAHGAMTVFSALLLMVPGFITSIIGLVFLLPPVRDLAWRLLKSRVTVVSSFGQGGFGQRRRDKTIDLDAEDFSRGPNADSPWRRLKDE